MKLTGFRASHRNRWLLVKNKILTPQEFLLLEYYVDVMDFDGDHDKFGTFEVFFDDIAIIFNRSVDSIRDWHNGLVEKNFVKVTDKKRHLFSIPSPRRYVISTSKKGLAYFYSGIEKIVHTEETLRATLSYSPENTENIPICEPNLLKENPSKALVSSKEISGFSSISIGTNSEAESEITDKDICDIFFQGNLFEYIEHIEKGGNG